MLWRKSFLCGVIPTGRKSQRKGADGERELAALLREYGYPVERGGSLSFGEVPDLTGLPGVHIECKRAEQLRPYSWLEQAERDAVRFGDGLPAVFFPLPVAGGDEAGGLAGAISNPERTKKNRSQRVRAAP